jgi:hypothetical protein
VPVHGAANKAPVEGATGALSQPGAIAARDAPLAAPAAPHAAPAAPLAAPDVLNAVGGN